MSDLTPELLNALGKAGAPTLLIVLTGFALKYGLEFLRDRRESRDASKSQTATDAAGTSALLNDMLQAERVESARLRSENDDLRDELDTARNDLLTVKRDYEAVVLDLRRKIADVTRQLDALQAQLQAPPPSPTH